MFLDYVIVIGVWYLCYYISPKRMSVNNKDIIIYIYIWQMQFMSLLDMALETSLLWVRHWCISCFKNCLKQLFMNN